MKCKYCRSSRKNRNSLINHERRCAENPNRQDPNIDYSKRKTSNGSLKAAEEGRIFVPPWKGKTNPNLSHSHTQATKSLLSEYALKRKLGGVTRSRWINYNGTRLGSSYEVLVAKELDKNQIRWGVPSRLAYTDSLGKKRSYTPDFYLPDFDIFLDPKNDYLINNINPFLGFKDSEKIRWVEEQNNVIILILSKQNLTWSSIQEEIIRRRSSAGRTPLL